MWPLILLAKYLYIPFYETFMFRPHSYLIYLGFVHATAFLIHSCSGHSLSWFNHVQATVFHDSIMFRPQSFIIHSCSGHSLSWFVHVQATVFHDSFVFRPQSFMIHSCSGHSLSGSPGPRGRSSSDRKWGNFCVHPPAKMPNCISLNNNTHAYFGHTFVF